MSTTSFRIYSTIHFLRWPSDPFLLAFLIRFFLRAAVFSRHIFFGKRYLFFFVFEKGNNNDNTIIMIFGLTWANMPLQSIFIAYHELLSRILCHELTFCIFELYHLLLLSTWRNISRFQIIKSIQLTALKYITFWGIKIVKCSVRSTPNYIHE